MAVLCYVCDKIFSTQYNLNKHTKRVHQSQPKIRSYDQSKWSYKCLESGCNTSFCRNSDLINHLSEDHHISMQSKIMTFANKADFLAWKHLIEKKDKSNYIMKRSHKSNGKLIRYYMCNRSGKKLSNSNNVRLSKPQGSCKLNRSCTSSIKVIEGNDFVVTWNRTHYGHSIDLQHIKISKIDRSVVASKLKLGVPPSRILDSYRDPIKENLNREDLMTLKDIQNIKNAYNINISEGVKHENDAITVELKYVRDKAVDQVIKKIKGKHSMHIKEIMIRHKTASSSKFSVEFDNESQTKWYINAIASSQDTELYCVEKLFDQSCCDLECRECKICSHTYSCTCNDFCVANKICKHIHYIDMTYYPKSRTEEILQSSELDELQLSTQYVNKSDILRQDFSAEIMTTMIKLQNADKYKLTDEVILEIKSHLVTVQNLLELPSTFNNSMSLSQEVSDNEPGNKKILKRRFFSTQKKTNGRKNICKKASTSELKDIDKNFKCNFTELYISHTSMEDHNYLLERK